METENSRTLCYSSQVPKGGPLLTGLPKPLNKHQLGVVEEIIQKNLLLMPHATIFINTVLYYTLWKEFLGYMFSKIYLKNY